MHNLAAGRNHTVVVDHNGSLWRCGDNTYSQLGYFSFRKLKRPKIKKLKEVPKARTVTAGLESTFFIDESDQAWSFGSNYHGELGLNKKWKVGDYPLKIKTPTKVKSVASAFAHCLLLDEDGNVWSSGNNEYGQLGLGDTALRKKAEKIEGLPPIKAVSCGYYFSTFLDFDGVVWTAGMVQSQRENKPKPITELDRIREVASNSYFSLFITENDNLIANGQFNSKYTKPNGIFVDIPPVKQAAASLDWSVFIDHEGGLWHSGKDVMGLSLPPNSADFTKLLEVESTIGPVHEVAAGLAHIICATADGSVYTSGSNTHGALGIGHCKPSQQTFNKLPDILLCPPDQMSNIKSARNI